ncbi:amiloride-sensitive sodium channel subunit alpha [Trichonephila clavata]|uniref:Amiloride-sensitive sodium channel subunit alpha n=1 Tax=Trichonephila clavata TaxID=2740835 RepID=A0A8X6FL66_TRICU|nr:amiloride-sensitive sodium channel subunit alpha [Trichonephila clavata]
MEMDINNTENGPEERKKSLKNYSSRVLKESSLSALSNIVSTKHPCRKTYKIIVLVLCFAGFFYQCFTLLSHIFRYPTIVDVRIENPDKVEMPALTFCDNNGISRKRFCMKLPHCCMVADDALCLKHPSYCNVNETMMVPRPEYYSIINQLTVDQLPDIGRSIEELLIDKEFQGEMENTKLEGPFIRAKNILGFGRMACYSLFSIIDSPKTSNMISVESIVEYPTAELIFDVNDEDQFVPGYQSGMFLSVHSPYIGINPAEKGEFTDEFAKDYFPCLKRCKDDCAKTKYILDVQERFTSDYDVEVFSYIGGFIGVWLGISLIQIADLVESIFLILCYMFKKKNSSLN